jgi:hypothetical protein
MYGDEMGMALSRKDMLLNSGNTADTSEGINGDIN